MLSNSGLNGVTNFCCALKKKKKRCEFFPAKIHTFSLRHRMSLHSVEKLGLVFINDV